MSDRGCDNPPAHAADDHTTQPPATDLGYLLHKNPARVQTFALAFGPAHVFYPEATAERCTAALAARRRSGRAGARAGGRAAVAGAVRQRPALRRVVVPERRDRRACSARAMTGRSKERPELADQATAARGAASPVLPCRGGEALVAQALRAARLHGRRRRGYPLDATLPGVGRERRTSRSRSAGTIAAARPALAPVRA